MILEHFLATIGALSVLRAVVGWFVVDGRADARRHWAEEDPE